MTSYIKLLSKIEAFCDAHYQIQRYGGEFREQMPNISTESEKYPIVFVTPNGGNPYYDTNQITLDIYCVDIIQKGRENINTIVSDCHLILTDLYGYFSQGSDLSVDVIGTPSQSPLNNLDLDYVAGWMMTITFEVDGYCVDAIPMTPITPGDLPCLDADVENSDASYTATVASGETLVLPDITVTDSDGSTFTSPSVKDITCTPSAKDLFLKGIFANGNDTMETLTIDADNAGTYTSISDDGASGTITLDINGGGFGAFVNPTVLAVNDVLIVKRTVTTASGWFKLTGTYV